MEADQTITSTANAASEIPADSAAPDDDEDHLSNRQLGTLVAASRLFKF